MTLTHQSQPPNRDNERDKNRENLALTHQSQPFNRDNERDKNRENLARYYSMSQNVLYKNIFWFSYISGDIKPHPPHNTGGAATERTAGAGTCENMCISGCVSVYLYVCMYVYTCICPYTRNIRRVELISKTNTQKQK